ncbi:hypothetical protein BKA00_001863 [Actinomadura coerulea]|uniref:Uncharacterized protein n=1 Tax=Actinomadura coerulea TaxID=46159 RepID=A0A7X0FWN7_9ACTN|nr:hypothetical protein [Actinomadura coerulea]
MTAPACGQRSAGWGRGRRNALDIMDVVRHLVA